MTTQTTSSNTVRNIEFILGCVLFLFLYCVVFGLLFAGLTVLFGTAAYDILCALSIALGYHGLFGKCLKLSIKAVHNLFEGAVSLWKWAKPTPKMTAQAV